MNYRVRIEGTTTEPLIDQQLSDLAELGDLAHGSVGGTALSIALAIAAADPSRAGAVAARKLDNLIRLASVETVTVFSAPAS